MRVCEDPRTDVTGETPRRLALLRGLGGVALRGEMAPSGVGFSRYYDMELHSRDAGKPHRAWRLSATTL